ncbi:unnamed protein product [Closterium sp. NIES-53]
MSIVDCLGKVTTLTCRSPVTHLPLTCHSPAAHLSLTCRCLFVCRASRPHSIPFPFCPPVSPLFAPIFHHPNQLPPALLPLHPVSPFLHHPDHPPCPCQHLAVDSLRAFRPSLCPPMLLLLVTDDGVASENSQNLPHATALPLPTSTTQLTHSAWRRVTQGLPPLPLPSPAPPCASAADVPAAAASEADGNAAAAAAAAAAAGVAAALDGIPPPATTAATSAVNGAVATTGVGVGATAAATASADGDSDAGSGGGWRKKHVVRCHCMLSLCRSTRVVTLLRNLNHQI